MEVKIRTIGNSLGIIFPKIITESLHFHAEDVIELEIDAENKKLVVERKKVSLRENLLAGINASQEENAAFANDFDEMEGEI
jgi:antitoxin component of MazEF toxin-antitoxin module